MAEMIYIFHGKNDLWAESAEYRTDRYYEEMDARSRSEQICSGRKPG